MAKVLLCPSAFYPSLGGVEEVCRNLGRQLQAQGFEVAVAVNRHPSTLPEIEEVDGLPVHRFPLEYPNRSLQGIITAAKIPLHLGKFLSFVRSYAPDILHVICPSSTALYCRSVQEALGTKVVVTLSGELFMDANQLYQRSAFARHWLSQLLFSADAVTSCSQYVMDDAKARFHFSSGIERVIFNGIDLTEQPSPCKRTILNRPFVFGAGRLVRNKGFDWLLRSFKLLAEDSEVDLVLAGDGPAKLELEALARTLQIDGRVHFVGRQDRASIASLFEKCLFFVLPSPVEPFGIVCLEAMRAGKPIISANTGGPVEFIGDAGLFVPPLDVESLYEVMKQLCSDSDLLRQLGANAKTNVQSFDWTTIVDHYIEIYRALTTSAIKAEACVS